MAWAKKYIPKDLDSVSFIRPTAPGLPIVRTSPSHGTAYEIAGKNQADATSFTNALFLAIDTVRNRNDYKTMMENARVKKPKLPEEQVST